VSFVAFKRKRQFLGKRFFSPSLLYFFQIFPFARKILKKGERREKKKIWTPGFEVKRNFLTPKIPLSSKWSTHETNETRVKRSHHVLNLKPQPY